MTDELIKCSRCFLTGSVIHFARNKRGQWYKQCNNCRKGCREKLKLYREVNKDKLKQKQTEQKHKKEMQQLSNQTQLEMNLPTSSNVFSNTILPSSGLFGTVPSTSSSLFGSSTQVSLEFKNSPRVSCSTFQLGSSQNTKHSGGLFKDVDSDIDI
jgi:hypothetical protein